MTKRPRPPEKPRSEGAFLGSGIRSSLYSAVPDALTVQALRVGIKPFLLVRLVVYRAAVETNGATLKEGRSIIRVRITNDYLRKSSIDMKNLNRTLKALDDAGILHRAKSSDGKHVYTIQLDRFFVKKGQDMDTNE